MNPPTHTHTHPIYIRRIFRANANFRSNEKKMKESSMQEKRENNWNKKQKKERENGNFRYISVIRHFIYIYFHILQVFPNAYHSQWSSFLFPIFLCFFSVPMSPQK